MGFEDYWYVAGESKDLTTEHALSGRILDRALVCFRGRDGTPAVLPDRCLHRNAPLSAGRVRGGLLSCPYHGWTYDGAGRVVCVPSMGATAVPWRLPPFPVIERDGYVYTRLNP